MTVDVEEYFHPSAMTSVLPQRRWESLPRRSPILIQRILEDFDQAQVRGTFFVLGWLAAREPGVVQAIAGAGHEIASHGWDHQKVTNLSQDQFREDVARSKRLLEDIAGVPVTGYRAPSFSIMPGIEWALDILLEQGFEYDSSMFPVRIHPGYGYPTAPRDPHQISRPGGTIWEIPPATLRVGGLHLPAAGGAYLRFFPLPLIVKALHSAQRRGSPGTVYIHPWEIDEAMPGFDAPFLTRTRMRTGIRGARKKLSDLSARFDFRPIRETISQAQG
jgi:polysaccharide deacetylase family protein (PEP-CTERM system associated)